MVGIFLVSFAFVSLVWALFCDITKQRFSLFLVGQMMLLLVAYLILTKL